MKPITFGIKTAPQHTTYEAMLPVWKEADENPAFDHTWLFDHYAPIHSDVNGSCLEGWTTLAALAAETSRIRLGLMVTGNTYRHPAVLASIAATVDIISKGRLDLGLGAGWNEYEHNSMGLQEGAHAGVHPDFEARNAAFFANPDRTNERVKLFYIAAGDNDRIVTDGPRKLAETLKRHGIHHEFHETEGGHTWINWRQYLHDFLPLLFQN